MSSFLTESQIEAQAIDWFVSLGYYPLHGPDIGPEGLYRERNSYSDVLLAERLRTAIRRINPGAKPNLAEDALRKFMNPPTQDLTANNQVIHNMLVNGVEVEYVEAGITRGEMIHLIDFDTPSNNEFVVCNQYTVIENEKNKRPDVVLFVNGIPLVVIELKNPGSEQATIKTAFTQLQNYLDATPTLFVYNAILVASDGFEARAGTISSDFNRFMAWKTEEGRTIAASSKPQLETLVKGMLNPATLLDLLRYFLVFELMKHEDASGQVVVNSVKKLAAYHQYYAVNKAVESTCEAAGESGNSKGGVVWHTQGSGKSLTMVFYVGKLVQRLDNPTIVVITDRNDLDDQLFDTFVGCKQLLRQDPTQAESREQLMKLLKVVSGGIVFTTIQKFLPEDGGEYYPLLSDRRNIVVIADEAHRSQYGFRARTIFEKDREGKETGTRVVYGFAKYMRDALPNATFLGFTGTPIEKDDVNTPAVFGNYVDIYDIEQAIEDGATVRILYESRLVKIHLKEDLREEIDEQLQMVAEGAEEYHVRTSKARWTRLEAIVGHPQRIRSIAEDIVRHFEQRCRVMETKAMVVTMSRRIAVGLYDEIIRLRPAWANEDLHRGEIKVVMTSLSSDPREWQKHSTTKEQRRALADRFKDPFDPLKLVIVRDMWLTGFDAPCLKTMYVDKPMQGHTLMQAIARVNRVYGDIEAGLVVDYIGIASDLKKAISSYTESGGKGKPALDQKEAVRIMQMKYEVVKQLFHGFGYEAYFNADTGKKLEIILEAQEHILSLKDGKRRFLQEVTALSKAYAISIPQPEALKLSDEMGFFQAVKARLVKFNPVDGGKTSEEVETAIKQIVDKAVASDGIIDVFGAAGMKKPDISILSDEFLEEIRGMKHQNIALELLKKLLMDEIRIRTRKNLIQGKKLSEMLENAIKKYTGRILSSAEIIDELIRLARDVREADRRGEELGLSEYELAFYDALADNESAVQVLGNDILRDLARVLVDKVRKNTTIDWTIKESVRARLRVLVKRTLNKYGYPPDQQKLATENVLKQAELLSAEWA